MMMSQDSEEREKLFFFTPSVRFRVRAVSYRAEASGHRACQDLKQLQP